MFFKKIKSYFQKSKFASSVISIDSLKTPISTPRRYDMLSREGYFKML
jgi:hypothetical protein